ncbi:MAG TPA: glycoside hydrolase family 2 TIM barrel-domain containing protein [Thermoanaerobaculia bacterium]|nr:glycoside hydrolase family 2 TIM barrel-domain containing protein [Thermoanaerobaculia bacterium]
MRALVLASLLLAVLPFAGEAAAHPRIHTTINDSWRYAPGAIEGAERPGFDDSAWERIHLPHTWNRDDAFDEAPGYRRGAGWYRRALPLDPAVRGKRLFLYFEGANQVADVWVNGRAAGTHVGGYTAFAFEVTDLLRWDEPNVVAVRVDNSHHPDIPPLNADFTFFGGIYRDVWLIATEPVHFAVTHYASAGVFVDTPEISPEHSQVRFRTRVENQSDEDVEIKVVHTILAADGSEAFGVETGETAAAGTSTPTHVSGRRFESPRLWSPDDPYLYRVRSELFVGRTLRDVVETPLGFRWFEVDPEKGFFLNGAPLKLYGTNRHQDRAGFGNALSDPMHRRDVEIVKENGFRFLRLAHYPQDPAVLEAADRLGLVVWEEIPIVNLIGTSDAFAENSERMLVEMVRQHYNHPSIVFWGYMNEVLLTRPDPIPEGYYERVLELARRLEARVRLEDPTRLTVMALSRDEVPPKDHGVGSVTDVLGFNFYFGWYYETTGALGAFLDEFHRAHPGRPLMVSEYGAGSDERVHTTAPRPFDFSSEYAQLFHTESFPQLLEREYLAGTAVWNQFDFASELRNDTKHAINQKGLLFHDRTPKDSFFYYQAALLEEPVLRIASEWDVRAGSRPVDRFQPIRAYTNLDEVIFFVNGATTGPVAIRNRTAETSVLLRDGENEIRASGRRGEHWFTDLAVIRYDDRALPPAPGSVIAVNAGSHCSYVDAAELVWEADRPYEPGGWGHLGGETAKTHHRIFATPDDPLHQWSREGMEAYRFDLPDGTYEIELGMVEWSAAAHGARVFDVLVNGRGAIHSFDPARELGRHRPAIRKIVARASGGEGITISFIPRSGKPAVASIAIRRLF